MFSKNKRVRLKGNRRERVIKSLEMAGWYSGRSVDITEVENFYDSCGVQLLASTKEFFREFYGLAEDWWIDWKYKPNTSSNFSFTPEPDKISSRLKYEMFGSSNESISSGSLFQIQGIAMEQIVYVGEIGYYYPARVWIGESGKIYTTHEYDKEIHVYNSIIDLIEWELSMKDFEYITIPK